MKLFRAILLAAIATAAASAQTVIAQPQVPFNQVRQLLPGTMSQSLVCIIGPAVSCLFQIVPTTTSSNPYLCQFDVTATGQTVTVKDGQSPAVPWIAAGAALPSTGSTATGFEWHADTDGNCRIFPNGLYVQAGGAGVTFSLKVKWNQ